MSNSYREPSRTERNSLREAEIANFHRLQLSANFLEQVVKLAEHYIGAQKAAIAAGVEPGVAHFGTRAMQRAIEAEQATPAAQSKTESRGSEPVAQGPAKPRALHTYIPRVSAPPMLVLAVRAAELMCELSPLIVARWKHLLNHFKVDPRRLSLNHDEERVAALMLDELGIQYHEIGTTDYARLRDALDKIEAWIKQARNPDEGKGGEAQAGPPGVSPPPCPVAEPDADATEAETAQVAQAAKPVSEQEAAPEKPRERPPATYSTGKESLDWTKL